MRNSSLVLIFGAAGVLLCGCPPEPLCGNAIVEEGETEETCCRDVGCGFGVCDGTAGCVDPWLDVCAGTASQCLEEQPLFCDGSSELDFDCAECGCADDGRCESGACYSITELALDRVDGELPTDLSLDEYFLLFERLAEAPLVWGAWVDDREAQIREDRRHSVVLIGDVGDTPVTRAVGVGLLEALAARGLGLRDGLLFSDAGRGAQTALEALGADAQTYGDAARADVCAMLRAPTGAAGGVGATLADEGLRAVWSDVATVHREPCWETATSPVCVRPAMADCVPLSGKRPMTLLVADGDALLARTDRVLLNRVGNFPEGEVLFQIDLALQRWREAVGDVQVPPRFTVDLGGTDVSVRIAASERYDDVWWAFVPTPGREPWGLVAFRAFWEDAPTKAFFLEHDINGRDCIFALSEGEPVVIEGRCENNGATVEGTVSFETQNLLEVTQTPPG
jgi:hypothetical protein